MTLTNIPDKFLTVREIAEILRVTPRTIYDYKKNRGLRFTRVGGSIRFTKSQLESWLRKNSQEAA